MNVKNPALYRQILAQQRERRRMMRKLRNAGSTLTQIGQLFGVTRQRVCQILKEKA